MPPSLRLIDAIGPFFRGYEKSRINWSKIPFEHLQTFGPDREAQWTRIRADLTHFCHEVRRIGYTAITLDDLSHLARHPLHEDDVAARIDAFREEFSRLFDLVRASGLGIYLTSDILPLTPRLEVSLGRDRAALDAYYAELVEQIFSDFPQVDGLILRMGESDGNDVRDPIRTRLHLTTPDHTNRLLRALVPLAEKYQRRLILRTWTVGAYRVGDLIWHRRTLARTLEGLDSPHFIVSMKYGESDFFRYLPLNRAFFRIPHPKIIEFQARREYEGAGEFPCPIGTDCERFAAELKQAENLVGFSTWCQTGGWHRFRRLAFLPEAGDDTWIRLNTHLIHGILGEGQTTDEVIRHHFGVERAAEVIELVRHAETVVRDLMYVREFASQKLFFRRVRIPPLIHLYWDCLFINHPVRKILRHLVRDPERALREGEAAFALFPRMVELARRADLPVDDLEHWRDLCGLLCLARRYYFLPFEEEIVSELRVAKSAYKKRWPKTVRQRYRIKLSFQPFRVKRRTLGWMTGLLLRKKRGYRIIDHVFTLHLLGFIYRAFKPRRKQDVPKFLRKSAMGIDSLFH
ncbi:hypothetical protein HNR46_000125 [Haloferula luteola]|uniref:Uncharacterized protein n=1 Tax=Haloferula luteola TaxID=595692 RepID=A0A840V2L2_9BACT|nr:hypothetical protein [Haloferula luteola]MBB5349904.1 hypothetical protein [Haloferula luteola]